ncbi:ABC transporter related protein [Magnetococcus marinus MC-1]|uniref:ATP-binding protein Uup n=1 Tax=Magnetococcus marinus (strain ATCC BAA-1437 / JCM 17883 / MC-1) TaxID=156889 RepID=A0L7F6_MAGMM|nr:ATP-binding cassette domain-containing protein [Magnetococcus marinus]ABK43899.1 ABC transporter related protein [Magnetococcus marinus MC-1]
MALLDLKKIRLGYGGPLLLDGVDFTIESGERVCLVGRNGSGKTTLFKVVAGEVLPDDGEVALAKGLKVARMIQDVPGALEGSVFDIVAQGLGETGELIARYHHAMLSGDVEAMHTLHDQLDATPQGWNGQQQIESALSRLNLDGDQLFANLSGGLKRRALMARAVVSQPDLLLLDEPTNHLDIPSIEWLESFLKSYRGTLLFITHDRRFLRALATRIVELDRGQLTSWPGNYDAYLQGKADLLLVEEKQNARFDKKLAQEEAWIRQGIKARRTRNEGRVRALQALRLERRARRELSGSAKISIQEASRSGRLVVECDKVGFSYADTPYIRDLTTTLIRGDKVGIVGPNGCGKTTLLNLLLGKLKPQSGELKLGTRLEIAYFDQHRASLDPNATVQDSVANGRDRLDVNGENRHVIGYLQDFLFSPERARSPVSVLSGGERNRLLLAKLFAQPANMLVLDEPTNDLDAETLELLESHVVNFNGTVLVVSHDREFLNNVVSSTLVFEGDALVKEYPGGYDDWLEQRPAVAVESKPSLKPASPQKSTKKAVKLTYKDQRALETLPAEIEQLEGEKAALEALLADPAMHLRENVEQANQATERLAKLEAELEDKYHRWDVLESKAAG